MSEAKFGDVTYVEMPHHGILVSPWCITSADWFGPAFSLTTLAFLSTKEIKIIAVNFEMTKGYYGAKGLGHTSTNLPLEICSSPFTKYSSNPHPTLAQVFSCEFCEISKNIFFTEHLWATASAYTQFHMKCIQI